jgi:hypothetical protein
LTSINTLDIEASGIHPQSYPIEVGIMLENGDAYCSLIKPPAEWTYWSKEAEAIHGISLKDLHEYGKQPVEVAGQLNNLLQQSTVYSDCWTLDNPWLIKLFQQASIEQTFKLTDVMYSMNENEYGKLSAVKQLISKEFNLERHRATNDARILQMAYDKIKN